MLVACCRRVIARRLVAAPATTAAAGGSEGRQAGSGACETASDKVRAPDAGAPDVTVQKARALRVHVYASLVVTPNMPSQAAEMSGNGPPLPGLEGRAHDAGLHAMATNADGREDLRAAASGGIQRGDSACVPDPTTLCITRTVNDAASTTPRVESLQAERPGCTCKSKPSGAVAQAEDKAMASARATLAAAADTLADSLKPAYQALEKAMQDLDDAHNELSRSHPDAKDEAPTTRK